MDKTSGKIQAIEPNTFQTELNKNGNNTTVNYVSSDNISSFLVLFKSSNHNYLVDKDGNISLIGNLPSQNLNLSSIKSWSASDNIDFHQSDVRRYIEEIEFVDYIPNEINLDNSNCWDVSENGDNTIIAWLNDTKLFIGGKGGVKANSNSSYIFYDFASLKKIIFNNKFDTSDAINMSYMFANSVKLEELDLRSFNTSNVTDMSCMFLGATEGWEKQSKMALTSLNVSSFDTSRVTNMHSMFGNCSNLTALDVSNFDTSNVTNMSDMFNMTNDRSAKLEIITLGNKWDTSKVTNMNYMFMDNVSLKTINAYKDFNTDSVTTSKNMFYNCSNLLSGYGTLFNSKYIEKEYAKINSNGQKGYFTNIIGNDTTISGNMGYVTNGLMLHFDGIQNTIDSHNANSTVWEDLTKSGYNGILNNGPIWGDSYLSFDGSNDWVNIGEINFDNITIEAVMEYNTVDTSSEKDFASNFQAGGYGLGTFTSVSSDYSKNSFTVYISDNNYRSAVSSDNYVNYLKYHLSGSFDGNTIKLWENNKKYANNSSGQVKVPNNNTNFILGADPNGESPSGSYVSMKLYSLRIYNRALSDDEIKDNYDVDCERFDVGKENLIENNQELEYIESNGYQHILTNVIPTNTTGIYARVLSSNTSTDLVYFGSKGKDDSRFWIGNMSNKMYYGWNSNTYTTDNISTNVINEIKLNYLNDRKEMLNDTLVGNISSELSKSNNYPITIFAGNKLGTPSYKSRIRLYEFRISENQNVTHDFIPVYNKIRKDVGLYDTINHKFYGNLGTKTFISGPNK